MLHILRRGWLPYHQGSYENYSEEFTSGSTEAGGSNNDLHDPDFDDNLVSQKGKKESY